jgi:hypothetical protein
MTYNDEIFDNEIIKPLAMLLLALSGQEVSTVSNPKYPSIIYRFFHGKECLEEISSCVNSLTKISPN